ncbi:MAG: hypothetical protein IT437_07690 [Phycisphaerales bacterium]|nr:hypothetical protein [Phycisphaerales bacterium]
MRREGGGRGARRLVLLNAGLLVLLAAVSLAPTAGAQRGGRAGGDYTMVSGRVQGGSGNVVYIVDAANQEMIAVRWNRSTKSLDGLAYRDLAADAAMNPGR